MFEQRKVGGYFQVVSELSSGGFGQTFLAEDLRCSDGARCVIKQLKPQSSAPEIIDLAKRLFEQEVRILYQLGEHPQIPSIIMHFEEAGEFYFVQEYIEGNTFAQEISQGRIFSQRQTVEIVTDLLGVLTFVHRQGVIHRDIKPSNLICRASDGKTVLIDFGAVKQLRNQNNANPTQMTTGTVAIGSEGYMPMEQLAGHPHFSSDVYAVGMFAIQLLTQTHPTRLRQNQRTGEWVWQDKASVNIQFAEFLNRMIRYDFRQRFADAVQALNYLKGLNLQIDRFENPVWNQNEISGSNANQRQTQATFFSPVSQPDNNFVNQPFNQQAVNYKPVNQPPPNQPPGTVEPIFAPPPGLPKFSPHGQPVIQNLKPIGAPPSNLPQSTQPFTKVAAYNLGASRLIETESITVGSGTFEGFGLSVFPKVMFYGIIIIIVAGVLYSIGRSVARTQQYEAQLPQIQTQAPPQIKTLPKQTPRTKENSGYMSVALERERKAKTSEDWYEAALEWKNAEEFYIKLERLASNLQERETAKKDRDYCASKKETAFKNSETIGKKQTRMR